jgi:hypothetical protein
LLLVSRPASLARTSLARIFLAAMLMIVLLAGAIPFSSLASSHECGMACCVGKPSHMAGSCSTALGDEEQAKAPAEPGDEHRAHGQHHASHSSDETPQPVASTGHQGAAKHPSAHHSKSGAEESKLAARIASRVLTTPCSPQCAAAAAASMQVRRPREQAVTAVAARLRPPSLLFFAGHLSKPLLKSAEPRRLSRPRAPPARAQ